MALGNLKPKSGGPGGALNVPAGTHAGVLVAIVDLGTQHRDSKFGAKDDHMVYLCWELPGVQVAGYQNRNALIGQRYTYSFHEKAALRQLVERWRTKKYREDEEFKPQVMLGQPCLVSVVSKKDGDAVYSNFDGCMALPSGYPRPTPQNKPLLWEIETGDLGHLGHLPAVYGEEIAAMVQASPEWKARAAGGQQGRPAGNGAPANPFPQNAPTGQPQPAGVGAHPGEIPF